MASTAATEFDDASGWSCQPPGGGWQPAGGSVDHALEGLSPGGSLRLSADGQPELTQW